MRPVQTTHDPVCTVFTTGRGGHTAVRQQFALQLDIHVVLLRNAATHTVPSSQLQPSTQANVSLVLYGLRPDRRCSPGSVATVRVTAASWLATLNIARQHQTSRNSPCYRSRILLTNGQQRLRVLILSFGCLHSLRNAVGWQHSPRKPRRGAGRLWTSPDTIDIWLSIQVNY